MRQTKRIQDNRQRRERDRYPPDTPPVPTRCLLRFHLWCYFNRCCLVHQPDLPIESENTRPSVGNEGVIGQQTAE